MAASFPGTEVAFVQLIDDPGGDPYEASQVNSAYDEIEAIEAHFGAGTDITAKGGIRLTILGQGGSTTVGYTGEVAVAALAGTPTTLIPGGAFDVTVGAVIAYMVEPSSGSASGGIITIYNGDTETIYDEDQHSNHYRRRRWTNDYRASDGKPYLQHYVQCTRLDLVNNRRSR